MDTWSTASMTALWYRRSKPQGKVKRRVQDLRIPSSSHSGFVMDRPALDLSHSESGRLAVDRLLSHGLQGYHEVLTEDGEVDFLSTPEKNYILENGRGCGTEDHPNVTDHIDYEVVSSGCQSSSLIFPMSSEDDSTNTEMERCTLRDLKAVDTVLSDNSSEVFLSRAPEMKDLVRQFINKAKQSLAVVAESFSDTELLCDLLEASRKRNVSVHLLLDHLNLNLFVNLWQELELDSKHFPKLSVRSVEGRTYCSKTGRKLKGQNAESFIITDWTEVLAGSFSFTWLSWQVHRNLAFVLKGRSVTAFHREFHRLHSSSQSVAGFVTFVSAPPAPHSNSTTYSKHSKDETPSKRRVDQIRSVHLCETNEASGDTQTKIKANLLIDEEGVDRPPVIHQKPRELREESQKQLFQVDTHLNSAEQAASLDTAPDIPFMSLGVNKSGRGHMSPDSSSWMCFQERIESHRSAVENPSHQINFNQTKRSGFAKVLNSQVGCWNHSLNIQPKVDFLSDSSHLQHPSASQLTPPPAFDTTRGQTTGLQLFFTSQPHKDSSLAMGQSPLKPQLPTDSKWSALGSHMHSPLYRQRVLPPRPQWVQNYEPAGFRAMLRHSSFGSTPKTEQLREKLQLVASLQRSKSMNENGPASFSRRWT